MTIEALFAGKNPQDFCIGKVTQVYRSNCVALRGLKVTCCMRRRDLSRRQFPGC